MNLRVAAEPTYDSVVDGPGLRTVIWCQGCQHHCPECHNPATHSLTGGFLKDADLLLKEVLAAEMQSGVTFSGGEPMLQPETCAYIAKVLKANGLNIWCYTGFTWEELQEDLACLEFLRSIDVLTDGKFMEALKSYDLSFCGSANQRVIDVQKSLQSGSIVLWDSE